MYERNNLDDRSLVERFKLSRDAECVAALFDRYAKRLYAHAYRICREEALAEDCVQETFRRAIEHIDRFDETRDGSDFWCWLVAIAQHACLDELRRRSFRHKAVETGNSVPHARPELSPDTRAMLSELREELGKLPPEYRLCYLLSQAEGYSYKEIMELTGFSYEQVKTHIQTAKRHIERRFR